MTDIIHREHITAVPQHHLQVKRRWNSVQHNNKVKPRLHFSIRWLHFATTNTLFLGFFVCVGMCVENDFIIIVIIIIIKIEDKIVILLTDPSVNKTYFLHISATPRKASTKLVK